MFFRVLALAAALLPIRAATLIRDVSIVDLTSGRVVPHSSVLISGGDIKLVGPVPSVRRPPGAAVVDGRGRYLMPGLWDMHVHLWYGQNEFPLFLSWGITGVRDMGSTLERTRAWQHAVDAGTLPGPHVITPGSPLDGRDSGDPKLPVMVVHTPDEARHDYDVLESEHVDFIKVLSDLPADAYFALMDRSRKWGLPVVGHVPLSIPTLSAVHSRQHSMEHLMGVILGGSPEENNIRLGMMEAAAKHDGRKQMQLGRRALDTFDWGRAEKLFAEMKLYDVWQTPTLSMWQRAYELDREYLYSNPELKRIPKAIRSSWGEVPSDPPPAPTEETPLTTRQYSLYQQIVRRMQDDGVSLLAGTDTGDPWSYPGLELHEELELLVKAGLTPLAALRTATTNAARFLEADDSLGRIAPGFVADMVLLDGNPLDDIRNTRRIAAVFAAGTYFPKSKLNAMVAAMDR